MHKIYTVTIIENGRLTWKVVSREKTISDYRQQDGWIVIFSIIILFVVAVKVVG